MDVLGALQAALDGQYEIVRELGRGGMAVVYLARDVKHDRQVAIKMLPPEMATSVVAERFLREIRTAAQLSHPNILPLHDSVAVDQVRCYVMPYVQGESLRERIERERQLGLEQAVDIARQVAAGLDYAHAHGIIHRDIKPENILLVGDQAVIADFGLARAVFSASSKPFTQTGVAVGTPAYMSPEQAAGDQAVDGRADVYSLGCVFFEMVAGIPPFRGATAGAVLAAHATRKVPSLRAERESCPAAVDAAVHRALAKVPADRFRTAGEFVHALESWRSSAMPMATVAAPARRPAWLPWTAGAAAVALLAVAAPRVAEEVELARTPLDSNRVAILPVQGDGGQRLTTPVAERRLTSAFMEWRDLQVVEPAAGRDATVDASDASRLARHAGASRFVLASLATLGDSVELRATLYDAHGAALRQRTLRLPDDARGPPAAYRTLAASLLRTSEAADDDDDAMPGTTRVSAWRAFTRGDSARRAWALPLAETELRRAVTLDPAFARAHLWLAQVLAWEHPNQPAVWGDAAGRALASPRGLGEADSLLAAGLAALASGRYPAACDVYARLHRRSPQSDLPWYGLGYCQGLDPVVIRSARSPSGWQFRGSAWAAAAALDSALAHAEGAPAFAYQLLGGLLVTEPTRARPGHAEPPDQTRFYAYPVRQGDTIAFVPYPATEFERVGRTQVDNRSEALLADIRRLDSTYHEWTRRAPQSGEAWAALAQVQELQGQTAALATVQKARALTPDTLRQLQLAVSEVRLLVKQERFAVARAEAESLLRAHPAAGGAVADRLAGVAALIGDVPRSARLMAAAARADPQAVFRARYPTPPQLVDVAADFLAVASSGACTDSLRTYRPTIERLLVQYVPSEQRDELRRAVLTRPLTMAFSCLGPGALKGLPVVDPLARMQQRLAAGDLRGVRALFDTLRAARAGRRPGDVALDHTYQEALVMLAMRDSVAAARYLDLPLTALPTLTTHLLDDVPAAAALGRALALRAELASAAGDRATARLHAAQVLALWSDASPVLQPVVSSMKRLSQ